MSKRKRKNTATQILQCLHGLLHLSNNSSEAAQENPKPLRETGLNTTLLRSSKTYDRRVIYL